MLEEDGLGRAHYRVLQVLAFSPGMPVSRLQDILGVTKQSLGRTLQGLDARAYLQSSVGRQDRRQKLLCLSPEGKAAEARLAKLADDRTRLETTLADPALYADGKAAEVTRLNTRLAAIGKEQEEQEELWLNAQSDMEEAQNEEG